MQIGFFDVFVSVIALIILAVPGFIFAKAKLLPESATSTCSTIVLYGCQCAMIFMCFQNYEFNSKIGWNMLLVAGLSIVVHFAVFGVGSLIVIGIDDKAICMRYANVFSNCGFMGIPFLQMLFAGQEVLGEILIYTAVILVVFNLLNWTLGVFIMTGDTKQISLKKVLLNPVIISIVIGFLFFIILKKPIVSFAEEGTLLHSFLSKIMNSIKVIGDMVTPLSMFVVGMRLANIKLKNLFFEIKPYIVCLVKLIIMPLIVILLVAFLPIAEEVKYVLFLLLAMPAASGTTLFAVNFGLDSDFASVCVLLSTLLSIVTIPLMYLAFSGIINAI
ncbi:MAG: AEC family transporter [Firmicutes bacterium]|nr:AEC family transporter [Candidatus Caballimonas caccae]